MRSALRPRSAAVRCRADVFFCSVVLWHCALRTHRKPEKAEGGKKEAGKKAAGGAGAAGSAGAAGPAATSPTAGAAAGGKQEPAMAAAR